MLPLLLGVAPLGLVVGIQAQTTHQELVGWASGFTIYGASAQLAALDLLDRGAGALVVVLTVVVINLRLALYSAAMADPWRGVGSGRRALMAALLVDPSFAVGTEGYARPLSTADRHRFYLGAAVTLWVGWQTLILAGMTLGPVLPMALHLEFAVPLCLIAMVAAKAEEPSDRRAAATAAAVAVATHGLPFGLGLPLAIAAGVGAGLGRQR